MTRLAFLAALAACADPSPATAPTPLAPLAHTPEPPEAVIEAIHHVLANDGPRAPDFIELACGEPHATRELPRAPRTWKVAVANDGAMAWALGTSGESQPNLTAFQDLDVTLEVLERGAAGWQLVASATSFHEQGHAPCPIGQPLASPRRGAPLGTAIVDHSTQVTCDDESGPLATFTSTNAIASPRGTMAWELAPNPAGGFDLVVLEAHPRGWAIGAQLWSPDPTALAEHCGKARGRIVVSDTTIEVLDVVTFSQDRTTIETEDRDHLDAIFAVLRENRDVRLIAIQAHASADEVDPMPLSERRGLAVRRYLTEHGVPIERLQIEFYGANVPPRASEDGKVRSPRRVEFMILERWSNLTR